MFLRIIRYLRANAIADEGIKTGTGISVRRIRDIRAVQGTYLKMLNLNYENN